MRRPPLVERAAAEAQAAHHDELGALLHVLAGGRDVRRCADLSGSAVATAWIASALAPGTPLFTVTTAQGAEAFGDDPDVHLVTGDWRTALSPEAPFDFVFVGEARGSASDVAVLAAPRATLVAVLPGAEAEDASLWLEHPLLAATAVSVGRTSAIVAALRG